MTSNLVTIEELMVNGYFISKIRSLDRMIDPDSLRLTLDLGHGVRYDYPKGYRLLGVDGPELHAEDPLEREAAAISTKIVGDRLANVISSGMAYVVTKKQDVYGRWLIDMLTMKKGVPTVGSSNPSLNSLILSDVMEILIRDRVLRAYDGKKARTPWAKTDLEYILLNYGKKV